MANTTNFGWETPDDTDLVKDGAAAMRTLGSAIDTSMMDLKGGTTGQVLSKNSNTDMDFVWVTSDDANAIQNAIVDAKGDLITATAADTPARLAVGTNGQVLTADSSTSTGLKWATAGGGGKVLQVVQATYSTETTITSTTYTDIGLSATITPSAATSKVLAITSVSFEGYRNTSNQGVGAQLVRGSTAVFSPTPGGYELAYTNVGANYILGIYSLHYLDSPNTTSSTTYKIQGRVFTTNDGGTSKWQRNGATSVLTLLEIGA
jgi:hypothetical protein